MGVFSVPVEVSDLEWRLVEPLNAWVDTGAFYTSVPRPLLETLDVVNRRLVPKPWLLLAERVNRWSR